MFWCGGGKAEQQRRPFHGERTEIERVLDAHLFAASARQRHRFECLPHGFHPCRQAKLQFRREIRHASAKARRDPERAQQTTVHRRIQDRARHPREFLDRRQSGAMKGLGARGELPRHIVERGAEKRLLVGKVAIDRFLADTGIAGNRVDADRIEAVLHESRPRRFEQVAHARRDAILARGRFGECCGCPIHRPGYSSAIRDYASGCLPKTERFDTVRKNAGGFRHSTGDARWMTCPTSPGA